MKTWFTFEIRENFKTDHCRNCTVTSFQRRKQRQAEIENNPYYMKGEIKKIASKRLARTPHGTVEKSESIPDLQSPLEIPGMFLF